VRRVLDADLFGAMIDSIDQMIWSTRPDGFHDYFNARWYEFTGVPNGSTDGDGWADVFHPGDQDRIWRTWRHSLATGEHYHIEYRLRHRSGVYRWVLGRAHPLRDASGEIKRWFGTCTDIHEMKELQSENAQREAKLRVALERLDLALDSGAVLGAFLWDVKTNLFTGDERFARTFALDPEACRAGVSFETARAAIHPGDWPRVETLVADSVARGGAYRAEYRVRQTDGSWLWIEANGRCEFDQDGHASRFPGVIINIDARRRFEEQLALRAEEARRATRILSAIIESVPALIYMKDREGRITIANQAVMALIGKPWEEVRGRTDADVLDDKASAVIVMANDRRIMQSGVTEELEEVVGHDARGPRIWLSSKTPFRDEDGHVIGLVGTSVEITERKRADETRQLLLRELDHRVKNLFAMAIGMVSTTARFASTPKEMATALTGRLMALSNAHDLIRAAVTQGDAGMERVNLADLVRRILTPHGDAAQVEIDGPTVELGARGASSLALVLHELATNASKYGALSTPTGRLRLNWSVEPNGLRLVWSETGAPAMDGPPTRKGFGSVLTRSAVTGQLGGNLAYDWRSDGLTITIDLQGDRLG